MNGCCDPTKISACSLLDANTTGRLRMRASPLEAAIVSCAANAGFPIRITRPTKSPSPSPDASPAVPVSRRLFTYLALASTPRAKFEFRLGGVRARERVSLRGGRWHADRAGDRSRVCRHASLLPGGRPGQHHRPVQRGDARAEPALRPLGHPGVRGHDDRRHDATALEGPLLGGRLDPALL